MASLECSGPQRGSAWLQDCSGRQRRYAEWKEGRRGVTLYMSERWCNPRRVTVKERLCTPDIELLALGLRLYYLPMEITSVIVLIVYILLSADAAEAGDVILNTVSTLQMQHHSTLLYISGEFNQCHSGQFTFNLPPIC